ncbi:MAG TPA: hypothetical protein VG297_09170 [Bryobacteraceae bacterium]|jgi:hypothetical protein|nr:hypothetical protein [Bryobacteraceae bacterium]
MNPRPIPALVIPVVFTAAFAATALLPPVSANVHATTAVLAAAGTLFVWTVVLLLTRRPLKFQFAAKKQHYIQACAQGAVLIYWGMYWPEVPAFAAFIAAQLLFAYAFDILLSWSRRGHCILGFAQFPVIFSINLFLWFRPDWFYLQLLMIALGLAAKEFIHWSSPGMPRDGRRCHIFNPSSLPLAVFSLVLLAAHASGITWGQEIATTQFYPPQMYLMLFLIGLPGQFFFGVTSMTMSAVIATWLFGRLYFAATGIYFFYDSYIPISVFLGMHLLFNDPSTSPRTGTGRVIYGALYGLSTVALYEFLGRAGQPAFYDKLLQVPLLNLSVKWIDGVARWLVRAPAPSLAPRLRNTASIAVWACVFTALSITQQVGDKHPGQWLPFWRQACTDERPYACPYLADLEDNFCDRGSGWACNEAGRLDIKLSRSGEDARRTDPAKALEPFKRGCDLGSSDACRNLQTMTSGGALVSGPPTLKDYPIILRGSKGEIRQRTPAELYQLACTEGWTAVCSH